MNSVIQSIINKCWLLAFLLLSACDLGNFDPVDIFTQEPLAEDAVALNTDCDFTLLVNNDRIQQSSTAAEIKGSLYADINGNTVYLGSGEFEAVTDVEGRVSALEGFVKTQLYKTDYFEQSVEENQFAANLSLITTGLPNVFDELDLETTGCFLDYKVSEDTAISLSGEGILKFQEFYINPVSQFMLLEGRFEVADLVSESNWTAIDPTAGFTFEATNSSGVFTFDVFDGNIYTEGSLPIIIDSILLNNTGSTIIDAAYENGGMLNFFNATNSNLQLGSNGAIEVSYIFADRLLQDFEFYANADKSGRSETLLISPSTSYVRRNNGVERFSFYGEIADATNLFAELLPGHAALDVLKIAEGTGAVISGVYTEAENNRSLTMQHAALLDLNEKGSYELRDAETVITSDNIEVGGIFTSPFNTLPDIFISGSLEGNGDMLLSGQSLFAVNFDGTTLPVTFSVNVELVDGVEELIISGLAEYCEGNNCNFLPLQVTADYEKELLQLCVDIPNRGEVCIE